jgi:flagellar biosynthesis/type III secretory pathway chaperone
VIPPGHADIHELGAEVAAFEALVDLLQQELLCLRRADADGLLAVVEAKLSQVGIVEGYARRRTARMDAADVANHRAALDAWLAHHEDGSAARAALMQLLQLALEAQRLNALNRRLATSQQRHFTRASVALHQAAGGAPPTYGPDGREQFARPTRPLGIG